MASKRKVNLTDYDLTTTLGTGSFGRVLLCKSKKTGEYFAMKRLKKADIIKLRQVDHVISENTILADIDHPFLVSQSFTLLHPYHQHTFLFAAGRAQGLLLGFSLFIFPHGLHCGRRIIYVSEDGGQAGSRPCHFLLRLSYINV